ILAKDRIARSQIVTDQIVPFLASASALAAQDASQRAGLEADMFRAAQLVTTEAARDDARLELAAENAKPNDERSAALAAKYQADYAAATGNADALKARVAQSYPAYARLADPGPVELADFQKHLASGEAFLTFVIGAKGSFALVVTRDGLTAAPLVATTQSLSDDVAGLRTAFEPRLGRLPAFSLKSSYALYKDLVAPVE